MYILRLDDAAENMKEENWIRIEQMCDTYNICPIVAVIPDNKDPKIKSYQYIEDFWDKVYRWKNKDWEIALHGYNHVFVTNEGGINPVNRYSEFAGIEYEEQEKKIKQGVRIFKNHGLEPRVFIAPAHTFDENTLLALKRVSNIRTISDTVASSTYKKDDFVYVPQQTGKVRKIPCKLVTFCYHPNTMSQDDFIILDRFLKKNAKEFTVFRNELMCNRGESVYDKVLSKLYFMIRKKK